MKYEKILYRLRSVVCTIIIILVFISVLLVFLKFNALMHVIISGCILMLNTVEFILDGILKDITLMHSREFFNVIWLLNFVIALFYI